MSRGTTTLKQESRTKPASLTKPVHVQVFVTPTCPYCPKVASLAHQAAVESAMSRRTLSRSANFRSRRPVSRARRAENRDERHRGTRRCSAGGCVRGRDAPGPQPDGHVCSEGGSSWLHSTGCRSWHFYPAHDRRLRCDGANWDRQSLSTTSRRRRRPGTVESVDTVTGAGGQGRRAPGGTHLW